MGKISRWSKTGNADHIVNWGISSSGLAFGIMIYTYDHWWGYGHMHNLYDTDSGKKADTDWHFLCCTYSNNEMKVFVDGDFANNRSMTLNTLGSNLYIGIRPDLDSFNTFDGVIDDIRIYNRALSDSEIKTLYTLRPPCWPMFQADNQRMGRSAYIGPQDNSIRWIHKIG